MKRFLLKLQIRLYALSKIFTVNLGSKVIYKGNVYEVCNGVRSMSWRLEPSLTLPDDGWVLRSECRKILSLKNLRQTYNFLVKFYEGYWLDIWTNVRPREKGEWY